MKKMDVEMMMMKNKMASLYHMVTLVMMKVMEMTQWNKMVMVMKMFRRYCKQLDLI